MPSLFILGDSTGCDYAAEADVGYYYKRVGFGTRLKDFFKDSLEIKNYAMSGRSSKSFAAEPWYKAYLNELKKGDFVIIAFGHNDEKAEDKTRYTDPLGGIKDEGSFKYSLYTNYIKPALDKGAFVTLCTPVVRRRPNGETVWSEGCLHIANGGDYAKCIRELAEELSLYITDNTLLTKVLYESLSDDETACFHAHTSSKKISVDNTHLNNYGAATVAYMMTEEIKRSGNPLGAYMKENIKKPDKTMLTVNPEYHEKTGTELKKSIYWSVPEPWWASVFGDMGGQDKLYSCNEAGAPIIKELPTDKATGKTYYEISAASHNGLSFHLRSGCPDGKGGSVTSVGKISESTDGIGSVFRTVDGEINFSLSARAHINGIASNSNQVSFGVIILGSVGDVDTFCADSYNYVAAGPLKMEDLLSEGKNMWTGFVKADGALKGGEQRGEPEQTAGLPKAGDVIELKLTKVKNRYTAEYNGAVSVFEAELGSEVYAGFFTARCADITFTDIVFNNEVAE